MKIIMHGKNDEDHDEDHDDDACHGGWMGVRCGWCKSLSQPLHETVMSPHLLHCVIV